MANSNLQFNDFNSSILLKNDTSSALLSAKTKANRGLVLTRYTIIKQSFLIYKYTYTVIAEEKAYTKKSYFC